MTALCHGIDLVEIARIDQMVNDHGERFLGRVFTRHEREYAIAGGRQQAERLAARFAAKEAVLKAIGTGLTSAMAWTDIEVRTLASGAPSLVLSGRVAQLASEQSITWWRISLSHAGGFAFACVIVG